MTSSRFQTYVSRPGEIPSGTLAGSRAARASASRSIERSGSSRTMNRPSMKTICCSVACSSRAAITRPSPASCPPSCRAPRRPCASNAHRHAHCRRAPPCIRLQVAKRLDRQAHQIGGDLRIRRLVALSIGLCATTSATRPSSWKRTSAPSLGAPRAVSMKQVTADAAQQAPSLRYIASCGKPAWSASNERVVQLSAKRPPSMTVPSALRYGNSRTRLRRRSSIASKPQCRAA